MFTLGQFAAFAAVVFSVAFLAMLQLNKRAIVKKSAAMQAQGEK